MRTASSPLNLALYVGPAVPIPAPRAVIEALTEVSVTAGSGEAAGFELKFNTSANDSVLQTLFLLSAGAIPPLIRVVVAVTVGGVLDVLMDGIVTKTQMAPDSGGGPSQLIVTGKDLSQAMNYIALTGLFPYPAMPVEARVALILAKYMVLGIVPLIIPTPAVDINNPLEKIAYHQGTDLGYVRMLAERTGYSFYIEPGPAVGLNIAYWGPLIRASLPQKALNVDMDAETNVESLSCSFNGEQASLPIVWVGIRALHAGLMTSVSGLG